MATNTSISSHVEVFSLVLLLVIFMLYWWIPINEKRECVSMSAMFFTCLSYFPSFSHFPSEAGESPYITSSGFQFLLLDTASQLWYFILQYLKTAQVHVDILWVCFFLPFDRILGYCQMPNHWWCFYLIISFQFLINIVHLLVLLYFLQSRGMDLVEVLSFLFQLSFSTLGRVSGQQLSNLPGFVYFFSTAISNN